MDVGVNTTHHGRSPNSAPVFLCLPAMGVAARYYDRFALVLASATGGDARCVELLSSGLGRRSNADFGYREIVEEQIPSLLAQLSEECPGRPLYVVGHSLGGQLAVLATAQLHTPLAGLVLVAAGTAHFRRWPPRLRWRMRAAIAVISAASKCLPWYPGSWLGFGGDQPRRLMRDWCFNAHTGQYALHGSRRDPTELCAALSQVLLPVLSVEVAGDLAAPPAAIAELLALLPAANVRRVQIAGVRDASPWRRHFAWAREPEPVVATIGGWLTDNDHHGTNAASHLQRIPQLPSGTALA